MQVTLEDVPDSSMAKTLDEVTGSGLRRAKTWRSWPGVLGHRHAGAESQGTLGVPPFPAVVKLQERVPEYLIDVLVSCQAASVAAGSTATRD
jgi:hypothetical protein